MILTRDDSDKSLGVASGGQVSVLLDESPTTGYRWRIDIEGDALVLVSREFHLKEAGAVGGSGRVHFNFSAGTPGRARLRFRLWKEWEGDASIVDRLDFDINVTNR